MGTPRTIMAETITEANAAFVDEDYETALELYAQCINECPTPNAYVNRSNTNIKLGNFEEAVQDADAALAMDDKFVKGYLRKGIAYFETDSFEPEISGLKTWVRKCEAEIKFTEPNDGAAPPMPT